MRVFEAQELVSALAMGVDSETREAMCAESVFNKPEALRPLFPASKVLQKEAARQARARRKELLAQMGSACSKSAKMQLMKAFDQGMDVEAMLLHHGRSPGVMAARLVRPGKIPERSGIYVRALSPFIDKSSNE